MNEAGVAGLPLWVTWLVAIGALGVTVGVLWRVVLFFVHVGQDVANLAKVIDPIIEIGKEFQANSGHSLRDTVDRIEVKADMAATKADLAASAAADAATKADLAATTNSQTVELHGNLAKYVDELKQKTDVITKNQEISLARQKIILDRGKQFRRGDGNVKP